MLGMVFSQCLSGPPGTGGVSITPGVGSENDYFLPFLGFLFFLSFLPLLLSPMRNLLPAVIVYTTGYIITPFKRIVQKNTALAKATRNPIITNSKKTTTAPTSQSGNGGLFEQPFPQHPDRNIPGDPPR
jgi:hypothetical protein